MSMLPVQTDWIPASTPTFTLCVGQVALALDTQFGKRRKVVSVPLCWGLSELTPVVLETVLASPQKSELFLALCMFIYCFKGIGYVFLQKKHITISTIVKKKKRTPKKRPPPQWGQGWSSTASSHLCHVDLGFPHAPPAADPGELRLSKPPCLWTPAPPGQSSDLLENWAMAP